MSRKTTVGDPTIAVGYLRASKDEQKLGPEAQRASIEAWAAREGVQVVAWHIDQGVCSVTPIDERPGLVEAVASLRALAAGVLVVAKRDRIARDPVLTAGVERAAAEAGAVVRSAAGEGNGSTPADEFMRGIIDSASRYERALIRTRTKAALAAKRARGECFGQVPFGFHREGERLVVDYEEQAVITRAHELRASGLSTRAIVRSLAAKGVTSPRSGRPLNQTQVVRLLRGQAHAAA